MEERQGKKPTLQQFKVRRWLPDRCLSPSYTFISTGWRAWARLSSDSGTDLQKFGGEGSLPSPLFVWLVGFFLNELNESVQQVCKKLTGD